MPMIFAIHSFLLEWLEAEGQKNFEYAEQENQRIAAAEADAELVCSCAHQKRHGADSNRVHMLRDVSGALFSVCCQRCNAMPLCPLLFLAI